MGFGSRLRKQFKSATKPLNAVRGAFSAPADAVRRTGGWKMWRGASGAFKQRRRSILGGIRR